MKVNSLLFKTKTYIIMVSILTICMLYLYNNQTIFMMQTQSNKHAYRLQVNADRINRLFKVLQKKELQYKEILKGFDIILFNELVPELNKATKRGVYKRFESDIYKYLKVENISSIQVTDRFIHDLNKLSDANTYENSRKVFSKTNLTGSDRQMVIVTAADNRYYKQLQATVYTIHKYFPNISLIVYDLGLEPQMLEKTRRSCKCEVRSLRALTNLPHVFELKKYAWKPLIVLNAFKDFDQIMYVDSSIAFNSSKISPVIRNSKPLGLLTQWINFNLTCYTNPKMFEWFNERVETFENIWTIDANFIIFYKNFINTLIMKAWVTCALDPDCIAPAGSVLAPCCGCHRYDQDALTIIATYFFNMPFNNSYSPAFAMTHDELYFHKVLRGHSLLSDYFQ